MTTRHLALIAAGLLLLLVGALFGWPTPKAPDLDFTLQSADGPVASKNYRGKAVLLYFGYTYCPDVCPTALVSHAAALKLLRPEELDRVAAIFVSVDPERDTPVHLKEYAGFFHPAMVGITGTPEEIRQIAQRYKVFYAKQPPDKDGRYSVDHSSESILLGPDGKIFARLPHASPPERIAAELRRAIQP